MEEVKKSRLFHIFKRKSSYLHAASLSGNPSDSENASTALSVPSSDATRPTSSDSASEKKAAAVPRLGSRRRASPGRQFPAKNIIIGSSYF